MQTIFWTCLLVGLEHTPRLRIPPGVGLAAGTCFSRLWLHAAQATLSSPEDSFFTLHDVMVLGTSSLGFQPRIGWIFGFFLSFFFCSNPCNLQRNENLTVPSIQEEFLTREEGSGTRGHVFYPLCDSLPVLFNVQKWFPKFLNFHCKDLLKGCDLGNDLILYCKQDYTCAAFLLP